MPDASSLESIKNAALKDFVAAASVSELEELRVRYLGKKGQVSNLMKELGKLSPEERKKQGGELNKLKREVAAELEARKSELEEKQLQERLESEFIDVTLPLDSSAALSGSGSLHPVTHLRQELERLFSSMGFKVVDGPEVEEDKYNFQALNIPESHPARDMQDTIWTDMGLLLRTHTSCIQARTLEKSEPPLRIVAPGRCFRYESLDASHEHTFYQMEGMYVDKHVSVAHLIYFMKSLLKEIYQEEMKIRLRPGYFPFVEPGFELDIWFEGKWLELLPCGLIHPEVLKAANLSPDEWQGFAFGLGLSRLAMSRYAVSDIRHFLSGDLRFLRQFGS